MAKRRRQRPGPAPRPAPQPNLRQIVQEELSKALALPAGAQATSYSTDYLQRLQLSRAPVPVNTSLPRDPYNDNFFGPGNPLLSSAIDQAMPGSGRPAPRRAEFLPSWNLQLTSTRAVPWTILRDSADQVSIMRTCIEIVKSSLTGLEWSFGIDSTRAGQLARRDNSSLHTVTADLMDKYASQTEALHDFWMKPDRINQWTFPEWLGALLEDQLVLDAVSIYPHLQLDGGLHSLEIIDSTTIKPLLDYRGATPQPPYPAYQQILFGFPRGEFVQSEPHHVDAQFTSAVYGRRDTHGEYLSDVLIYKVRNRRSRSPYGFSCVEQALTDVDLWLRRYDWLRAEYQAGSTPEMIVKVDANMTPEQLRQYEAVFNDDLSGNNQERHRARFLPAGFEPSFTRPMDAKFSNDFDLHLIRLICAAFDVLPTSLGFTPNHGMGGMGGQGHQQGEQDTQLQRATKPVAAWVKDLINEICWDFLDMPTEVTFQFHGLDPDDEQKEADLLKSYVQAGLQTINEGRDQQNLPRYDFPEADQPMIVTPTGPVWLNVAVQPTAVPGNLPNQGNSPGVNPQQVQTTTNPPKALAEEPEEASKGTSPTHRRRVRS